MLSLAYLSNGNSVKALDYVKKSLEYFRNTFILNRTLDCYIILGISYKRNYCYRDAFNTFELAFKIATTAKLDKYYGIILHNIGSIHALEDNIKSIDYYLRSLSHKNEVSDRLITIFSLIKVFANLKDWSFTKLWLNRGFMELKEELSEEKFKDYHFHFLIYESISNNKGYIDPKIASKAIDHFEKAKDYRHSKNYSIMLGDTYAKLGRYKDATITFQKV